MRATMRSRFGAAGSRRRAGQALLVAVLLMLAILLVGILFVALVSYNQSQSVRHEDMVLAQALAEWGIRYADQMLMTSAEGADWRPPDPPALYADGSYDAGFYGPDDIPGNEDDYYTDDEIARGWAPLRAGSLSNPGGYIRRGFTRFPDPRQPASSMPGGGDALVGRGYFLLRVTYDPDPPYEPGDRQTPDPLSRHIKIESIGRVVDMGNVHRMLVAYKPLGLTDYARFVTDVTNEGRPAELGIPAYLDMNNDGVPNTTPVDPNADISDPASVPTEWLRTVFEGPIKANTRLLVYGTPYEFTGAGAPPDPTLPSTRFELVAGESSEGYLRDDAVEATAGVEVPAGCDEGAGVYVNGGNEVKVHSSDDSNFDPAGGRLRDGVEGKDRFSSPLTAPLLSLAPEGAGMERYRKLTRDSGIMVNVGMPGAEEYVNNGRWGHGAGIYVDNFNDVQYMRADGKHDLEALLNDWQRPMGAGGTPPSDSGWNAIMTTYSPLGVEIEFFATAAEVGPYSTTLPVGSGQVWWPNHDLVNDPPGIKLTRHDRTWRTPDGQDSGQYTMVVDYPAPWLDGTDNTVRYPVIFAEGNIRVKGKLPRALRSPAPALTLRRSYDLTIVSNATIYIDGQLLSPQDQFGRAYDRTQTSFAPDSPVVDEDNTMVALLARDCVCLNTTQIVPQLTTGLVSAAPDDPTNVNDPNRHWELAPGSGGRCYSTWMFGETPPAGGQVNVVAYQTAADPGPSGMSLTVWNGTNYTAHSFGSPPAPLLGTTFLFVPPATVIPGETGPAPYPYCSTALAPVWEEFAVTPPGNPRLPWDISAEINATAGARNGIIFRHEDPGLGAGSTAYWLKKWKIEQLNADGQPIGAIGAKVSAVVYAERGCWYVLTADYFDDRVTGTEAERFRRYNYKIDFRGTIAENFTAPLEAVRGWTDRCAYPNAYHSTGALTQWGSISYHFAEALRIARDQGLTTLAGAGTPPRVTSPSYYPVTAEANLPKLPLLPVSPDLIYYGEAQ